MLSKIKALLDKVKSLFAHSVIASEVKAAVARVEGEALAAVHDALAKVDAVTPEITAAVEAAAKSAIEAVAADIVASL